MNGVSAGQPVANVEQLGHSLPGSQGRWNLFVVDGAVAHFADGIVLVANDRSNDGPKLGLAGQGIEIWFIGEG